MRSVISIVDGNYFVNFAAHSKVIDLEGPNREPVGALHVFLNSLHNIQHSLKSKYLIVVFDGGRAAFRKALYPEYKERAVTKKNGDKYENEDRQDMKEFAFKVLNDLLPAMGIPSIRIPMEEADDVIYVLTRNLIKDNNVLCVTSDEDYLQMIKLGATVVLYRQDEQHTRKTFKNKFGFDVDGFTLYKAIKGDGSDNIKGVPNVGHVNASRIISSLEKPSLECLYDYCEDSSDKKCKAVFENFKTVKRNIRLMDLDYVQISDDTVMKAFEDAQKEAAEIRYSLVKKIFHNYDLSDAALKWLPLLLERGGKPYGPYSNR